VRKVLAQGQKWIMTLETHPKTLDRTYLQLETEHGTVELVSFNPETLRIFEKIESECNKLREDATREEYSEFHQSGHIVS
jgi:hypothetical protein